MKLYVIVDSLHTKDKSALSICRAAKRKNLSYVPLSVEDIVVDDLRNMTFTPNSLLYRVNTSRKAQLIESMLLSLYPETFTTIRRPRNVRIIGAPFSEIVSHISSDLSIIPTSIADEAWLTFDDRELASRAEKLSGFPIIVKKLGLSHGVGVTKVDTVAELRSCVDAAVRAQDEVIIRQYLADYTHYRLIVVDDTLVAAIEYHKPADDFRTNATDSPDVSPIDIASVPSEISDLAIAAVKLRGSLLGGVDILVDNATQLPYLAEVNVPCNFSRAEGPTGIDIAGELIDALLRHAPSAT